MTKNISLTGISRYIPCEKIENSFFDDLSIGSSSSWIKEKTGIVSRYSVLNKTDIISLAHKRISYLDLKKQLGDPGASEKTATLIYKAIS